MAESAIKGDSIIDPMINGVNVVGV
ncbi:hypothetical protein CCACVL1_23850 [Corchorus capsularis]|uniref:Uncharacterized protein n=1 Tax=Corchorus capsularis TaxID=210143 RepID=A0A1R3GS50_COCAP|nr:hypothetical protein CCACVL1_23850 [Corchorus capsularis]